MIERIFGDAPLHETVTPRCAAYVVVRDAGSVAVVKHGSAYFLPGGGSAAEESPVETITREVREELACEIAVDREIGRAVQFFFSSDDQVYYRMHATFFTGRFVTEPGSEICWLPESDLADELFHECHAWAVTEAATESR
jgi:8-oxo-dGTP diphosphatase